MKKIITIVIEDPIVISLNRYRTTFWAQQAKIRDDQYLQLYDALRTTPLTAAYFKSKSNRALPFITEYPVSIKYILEKPHPFDASNIVTKYWEDGLVRCNILENDSPNYVESITLVSRKAKKTKLTIQIYQ